MSVLIKGMEMPKSCIECRFCGEDAMCDVLGEDLFDYLQNQATYVEYLPDEWKTADCPLVPVPDHGDLIDRSFADVLSWKNGEHGTDFEDGVLFVLDKLDALPIIIPADPAKEETE